ncbi:hypothetical protein AGOR_G00044330 [Albula goreensis]|uniref:Uncharacterized protein n=1 Tax=Albula goreensis TaxID=1534307 RepID=A0A8T3E2D3_9TELE|nr:hypothetical protein AGOR_G00044330 [Albula goreensis]
MSTSERSNEAALKGHGPSEAKGEEAESDARHPNQSDAGESCGATVTVPKETEPMGSMLSLRKEAGKSSEDGEKPTASTSSSGKGLTGHAAKTLPASSSSASSSSSSAGRAKMSVSGPGNKPFQPLLLLAAPLRCPPTA